MIYKEHGGKQNNSLCICFKLCNIFEMTYQSIENSVDSKFIFQKHIVTIFKKITGIFIYELYIWA